MKRYFQYFKWIFVTVGLLAVAYAVIIGVRASGGRERENTQCLTEERVFDYGDVLTDVQEEKLRSLIEKRERQTGCDIVLVTLNESLKEYAREKEENVSYDQFVRVYAENFYDDNRFGYNAPSGDGILLLDNWYREDDGSVYTWLCTTGRVKERYGSRRTDRLLDNVYRYVEKDPYRAYKTYINDFYRDMTGSGAAMLSVPRWMPFAAAAVAMLVFMAVHWNSKKGKRTTTAATYVNGGRPQMNRREDVFINKIVTTRHIERSSGGSGGSGGGGGGGGGHGGGGHSR